MSAGLQVHNTNGVLQIDETFKNLVLIQKGTLPTGTPATLTFTGRTNPVLVFAGNSPSLIWSANHSGSTFTYTIYNQGSPDTYYLFDSPPAPALHGFGLQVFDASGNCSFDSNRKYMRPKGEITTNISGGGPNPPAGRNGAIVLAKSAAKAAGQTYGIMPIVFPWFMDVNFPNTNQITIGAYGFLWEGNDLYAQRLDNIVQSGSGTNQVNQATLGLVDISGL